MKKIFSIILAACVSFSFIGCENELNLQNPNKVTDGTFWKTVDDFKKAVNAGFVNQKFMLGYSGYTGTLMRISRGDDVDMVAPNDGSIAGFTNTFDNGTAQGYFSMFYKSIARANDVISRIQDKDFSKEDKDLILGEAHFLRGFCYFNLARHFQNVPIRLIASQDPADFPLATSEQSKVYEQAVSDFSAAEGYLPLKNPNKAKPSKGSAVAFLGKVYVYMENWKLAKETLEPLTKSPYTYKLVDFSWNTPAEHEYNEESIYEAPFSMAGGSDIWTWGEDPNASQSTAMACQFAHPAAGGWRQARVSRTMIATFLAEKDKDGKDDIRARESVAWDYPGCMYYKQSFQEFFDKNDPALKSEYWIIKYQNSKTQESEGDAKSAINERIMRYANVLLLLAECELNLQNLDGAIGYLDQIRKRANLNKYEVAHAKTQDAIMQDIINQRAIEFFRDGERFDDLRRWGLIEEALEAGKNNEYHTQQYINYTDKYQYFPIPAKEIQTNPLCEQNAPWR